MPDRLTKIDATQLNLGIGLVANPVTGELLLDYEKIAKVLGLGALAKMNVATVEVGGTSASEADAARKNLEMGTAAIYDVGTARGTVPVYGDGNTLPAEKFLAGDTTMVDANGVSIGNEYIVRSKGSAVAQVASAEPLPLYTYAYVGDETGNGTLYITDATIEAASVYQVNELILKLKNLITEYNKLIDQLKNHHGLIS